MQTAVIVTVVALVTTTRATDAARGGRSAVSAMGRWWLSERGGTNCEAQLYTFLPW